MVRAFVSLLALLWMIAPESRADSLDVEVVADLGPGAYLVWSPTGEYISFQADGWQQIVRSDGTGHPLKVTPSRRLAYIWASDSEFVYMRRPRGSDSTIFESIVFHHRQTNGMDTLVDVSEPSVLYQFIEDERSAPLRVKGPIRLVDGAVGYVRCYGNPLGKAQFVAFDSTVQLTEREKNWPWLFIHNPGEEFSGTWGNIWLKTISSPLEDTGRPVLTGHFMCLMSMAPTGERFVASTGGTTLIVDTAGHVINSHFQPIFTDTAHECSAGASVTGWSTDGQLVTFDRYCEGLKDETTHWTQLCVSDLTGVDETILCNSEGGANCASTAWSPVGPYLAVADSEHGIRILKISK